MPPRPSRRSVRFRTALVLAAVGTLPLASCGDEPTESSTEASRQKSLAEPESLDVFDWLKTTTEGPKLPGRMTTDEALALAHEFEARGAAGMIAVGNRTEKRPGGPAVHRSFGMVLRLPPEPARRLAVFKLYAEQWRNYGEAPQADTGQTTLLVPWTKNPQDE